MAAWEVKVEGQVDTIYTRLKDQFHEDHVTITYDEKEDVKQGRRNTIKYGARTHTEPGVSEQFRTLQKSWQSIMSTLTGKVRVHCGGDPDKKSVWMKVEAA